LYEVDGHGEQFPVLEIDVCFKFFVLQFDDLFLISVQYQLVQIVQMLLFCQVFFLLPSECDVDDPCQQADI
jgi:hypothetical protein